MCGSCVFEFTVDSILFLLFLLSVYSYLRAFLVAYQAELPPRLCFLLQERRLLDFWLPESSVRSSSLYCCRRSGILLQRMALLVQPVSRFAWDAVGDL